MIEYSNQDLQNRISALAEQQDITLYQLEKRIGLSRNVLVRCNISSISWDKLALVADYFEVSIDDLAGRTERLHSDQKNMPAASMLLLDATKSLIVTEEMAKLAIDILKCINQHQNNNN